MTTCCCRCSASTRQSTPPARWPRSRRSPAAGAGAGPAACASGGHGGEPLGEDLVQEAFAMVTSPGRLEVLRRSPVVIADSAHNPAGMAASVAAVTEAFFLRTLIAVLAISEDKDVPAVLDQLEAAARGPAGAR